MEYNDVLRLQYIKEKTPICNSDNILVCETPETSISNLSGDLAGLDEEIAREMIDVNLVNLKPMLIKSIVDELHGQIASVDSDITFLKEELRCKNKLLGFFTSDHDNHVNADETSSSNGRYTSDKLSARFTQIENEITQINEMLVFVLNQFSQHLTLPSSIGTSFFEDDKGSNSSEFLDNLMDRNSKLNNDKNDVTARKACCENVISTAKLITQQVTPSICNIVNYDDTSSDENESCFNRQFDDQLSNYVTKGNGAAAKTSTTTYSSNIHDSTTYSVSTGFLSSTPDRIKSPVPSNDNDNVASLYVTPSISSNKGTSNRLQSDTVHKETYQIENTVGRDQLSLDTFMTVVYATLSIQAQRLKEQLEKEHIKNKNTAKSENMNIDFAPWEEHSSGFATTMMQKMGYNGGGLGKSGNGIVNPIKVTKNQGRNGIGVSSVNETPQERVPEYRTNNKVKPWPRNTTLIVGDSILSGVEESRLKKYNVKVRVQKGACVDDFYDHLKPYLKKKPTNIIMHIGSNDAPFKNSESIANEILHLKDFIMKLLPNVKLFFSCPTARVDNLDAHLTLCKLVRIFKTWDNFIENDNIDRSCLGRKGLHLNKKGSGRLAINYISQIRRL